MADVYTIAVWKTRGIYEPLVWVRSDTVVEGSLIAFGEDPAFDPPSARLLHAECAGRSGGDR